MLEHVRDSSECPVNDYEFVALDMKLGTHVVMMDKKLLQDI